MVQFVETDNKTWAVYGKTETAINGKVIVKLGEKIGFIRPSIFGDKELVFCPLYDECDYEYGIKILSAIVSFTTENQ